MRDYGTCRKCGNVGDRVVIGGYIGRTKLCPICVSLVRDWIESEYRGTTGTSMSDVIGRRNLQSSARFAQCPEGLSDWADNQDGDQS